MQIQVTGQPGPAITALNPSSTPAGGFSFDLEVDGSGFTISSYTAVQWNGVALNTTYVSPKKLMAVVLGNLIVNPGTAQVAATNGPYSGGLSNAVTFTVTAAAAQTQTAASQKQSAATAGAGAQKPGKPPGPFPSPKYLPRFVGWHLLQKEGPEYVKRFQRSHAASLVSRDGPKAGNPANGPRSFVSAQSLSASALPGFQFRPAMTTDLLPTSLATGDFNRDGHMDWVVANGGTNTLWLYFGNGDGTAQPPVIVPLKGQSPVFVAAADLRGIGILDLIVAESDSGQVGVLLGNGDGTFGIEKPFYVPGGPICLLIDDFNGDGKKDILVGMAGNVNIGELALLPGDGTGNFGSPVYRPYEKATTLMVTAFPISS
jgi:hypothetical protein